MAKTPQELQADIDALQTEKVDELIDAETFWVQGCKVGLRGELILRVYYSDTSISLPHENRKAVQLVTSRAEFLAEAKRNWHIAQLIMDNVDDH